MNEEIDKEIEKCVEHNKAIIKLMLESKEVNKKIGELLKQLKDKVDNESKK